MDRDRLLRLLQSVGMTCFVTHLPLFESNLRDAEATIALQEKTGWKPKATRTRVSNARAILVAGERDAALALITAAQKVPEVIRAAARAARVS